jgi:hypothetical protein
MLGSSCVAAQLEASQKGLSSMKLVSVYPKSFPHQSPVSLEKTPMEKLKQKLIFLTSKQNTEILKDGETIKIGCCKNSSHATRRFM